MFARFLTPTTAPKALLRLVILLGLAFQGQSLSAQDVDAGGGAPTLLPAPTSVIEGEPPIAADPTMPPPSATEQISTDASAGVPPFDAGYLDSLIKQGDFQEAERLTQTYHHAPTAVRLGWLYFDQGDFLSSSTWFDYALAWLQQYPDEQTQQAATTYPSAVEGKAFSLFKDNRIEEAEVYARRNQGVSDKISSLLADILIIKAGRMLANRQPQEALNLLEEARPLRSAGFTAGEMLIEAWANYNLGWENLQQFQRSKEAYYREVSRPYLDTAAAIFQRSFPLIDGMSDEVEREDTRASALEGLARTEYARGNYQEAYRLVNSPNFTGEKAETVRAEIRAGVLAAIYADLTPQQKLQYLEGLRQRTPLTPEQTLEHGMMYLELKQYTTAAKIFEYLLNQSPPPDVAARAAMGLAFSSNEVGDYNRARAAAEQALRLRFHIQADTVSSLESMLLSMDAQLAVAAYNAKDYAAALQLLDRVRARRPLNLGERSVEAWSLFHLDRADLAYTLFENLYRNVRDVRRRSVQWDPSLPEYLRPTNTYIPDMGPDPLPTLRNQFDVPPVGATTASGSLPYNYTYPGQTQPATAPAPPYYLQQQGTAPVTNPYAPPQNQVQPQIYYLPQGQTPQQQQQIPYTPQMAPPAYSSPGTMGPLGYNYNYNYQPVPRYDPRAGRKHPLMQNLFDLPPGALPPTLDQAIAQTLAETGGENPALPSYNYGQGYAAADNDGEALFGQGDGEEVPVISDRFARDFLKSEYGIGVPPTGTTNYNPTQAQSQAPTAYGYTPPAAAPAPNSTVGSLPSMESLTGATSPAPPPSSTYTGVPVYPGAMAGSPPPVSPYMDPAAASGPGYYAPPTAPTAAGPNAQFDNLIANLAGNNPSATTTVTTTTTAAPTPYIVAPQPGASAATATLPNAPYTVIYAAPAQPVEVRDIARPVIVEPDISLPGEPYVPKLTDLAQGLYSSAERSGQLPRARLLARELGGPLAAKVAEGMRGRRLYLEVQRTFLASEPNLENYDTGRLTGAVRFRSKSGTTGLGELSAVQFPVITYEGFSPFNSDTTRFAAEGSILYLDNGTRDSEAAFGRFPLEAERRIASDSSEEGMYDFRLKLWQEDWTSPFIEIGSTPINGAVNATPVGRLGLTQQFDRGYWRADLFRESKKESVLAWVGEVDPYSGEAWGRVTETGVSAEFLYSLGSDQANQDNLLQERNLSVFGKGTVGFISGEGVQENTHYGLTAAIQQSFETDSFEFLLAGIGFSAEHYEKNLSQFTYGHGGYFSPQQLLQAQLFLQFMTNEGYHHLISGQASIGYQTNRQDGTPFFPLDPDSRNYPSERQSSTIAQANISAAFLLDPQWKFTVQAGAASTATYDEFFGGFLFTYFFEPRKGLYSTDLGTPFYQQ